MGRHISLPPRSRRVRDTHGELLRATAIALLRLLDEVDGISEILADAAKEHSRKEAH